VGVTVDKPWVFDTIPYRSQNSTNHWCVCIFHGTCPTASCQESFSLMVCLFESLSGHSGLQERRIKGSLYRTKSNTIYRQWHSSSTTTILPLLIFPPPEWGHTLPALLARTRSALWSMDTLRIIRTTCMTLSTTGFKPPYLKARTSSSNLTLMRLRRKSTPYVQKLTSMTSSCSLDRVCVCLDVYNLVETDRLRMNSC